MATVINNRSTLVTDPLRNFRFLVAFKALTTSGSSAAVTALTAPPVLFGFTSVSGLAVTTASIPYREGGYNTTVHQIPGQTTFSPVTLQRGVMLNTAVNWNWMKNMFQTVSGTGSRGVAENFRVDLEISVLSHPIPGENPTVETTQPLSSKDHVAMRFNVYNCWPTSVAYSDLNAGDDALFVEQMTLVHEGFDTNWATALTSQGQAPAFDA